MTRKRSRRTRVENESGRVGELVDDLSDALESWSDRAEQGDMVSDLIQARTRAKQQQYVVTVVVLTVASWI